MPIAIQCASCQTSLKAPDHLAGKKVKCPKCAQVVTVPPGPAAIMAAPRAAPGITSAPPPRPAAPAAAAAPPKAAAPPVRLPLLSFEELKVPGRLRRTIEREVGGEQMIWLGRPSPSSLFSKAVIGMWAGLAVSLIVIVAVVVVLIQVSETMIILVGCGIAGLVLLTMGLPMATMPIWIRWLVNYRDCYVLTPSRAIVFDNEKILVAEAKSYTPDQLAERALRVHGDGSGSIIFATEVVDLGIREKRRTQTREGSQGEKIRVTTITRKRERANKQAGFLDVDDVLKVDAMLRHVLRLGPPASKDVD